MKLIMFMIIRSQGEEDKEKLKREQIRDIR